MGGLLEPATLAAAATGTWGGAGTLGVTVDGTPPEIT